MITEPSAAVLDAPHPPSATQRSTSTDPLAAAGLRAASDEPRAGLCGELIARCLDEVFVDPARAVATSRQALRLCRDLAASRPGEPWVDDLEAGAWAAVANAERVAADLDAAREAMDRADACRAAGTGSLPLAARIIGLRASLEWTGGRRDEAMRSIDDAIGLHLRLDPPTGLGRALVQKAVYLVEGSEAARAVEVLQQAFEHLVPREDRWSVLAASQCLACCLHQMGYDIPAAEMVDKVLGTARETGDSVLVLRLEQLKVEILMSLGQDVEAELRRLRDALLDRGLIYDAAVCCLDLGTYYCRRRRLPDLQRLALEMFPIFTSRKIHREALAALLLLRDDLSSGRAQLPFLEEVRDFLDHSRHDHRLRFQPRRRLA